VKQFIDKLLNHLKFSFFSNSKKLFITDFKIKKKFKTQNDEEIKNKDEQESQIFRMENSGKNNKYDKDFIELNKKNVIPLRYQFLCDNLPDNKKEKLQELMKEIDIGKTGDIPLKNNNPFLIDELNQRKLKEIDQKLENFVEETKESTAFNYENSQLEKINDELYVFFSLQ